MEREVKIGIYRHFKSLDMLYEVSGIAIHTETGEELVIYKSLYEKGNVKRGQMFARPKKMFLSKVPDDRDNPNNQEYRFEYIGEKINA